MEAFAFTMYPSARLDGNELLRSVRVDPQGRAALHGLIGQPLTYINALTGGVFRTWLLVATWKVSKRTNSC